MAPPALLSLALGTLGVLAALPDVPVLDVSRNQELGTPFNVTCIVWPDPPVAGTAGTDRDLLLTSGHRVTMDNWNVPLTSGHRVTRDSQNFPLTDGHRVTVDNQNLLLTSGHRVTRDSQDLLLTNGHRVTRDNWNVPLTNGHRPTMDSQNLLLTDGHRVTRDSQNFPLTDGDQATMDSQNLPLTDGDQDTSDSQNFPLTIGLGGDQATVVVTVDNQGFPLTASPDGRGVRAVVTLNRTGSARVSCSVRVGGVDRRTSRTVHVYYVPEPLLDVAEATAGAALSGSCSLPPGAPRDVQVRVLLGDTVLEDWGQPPLAFLRNVSEEEEELELRCQAELQELRRSRTLRVPVLAPPRLDAQGCPPEQEWTEGREEVLTCRARGRPEPRVECSGNGNSVGAGTPQRARSAHAGRYRCRARNALGTAETEVTVRVLADHSSPLLPALLGVLLPALTLLLLSGLFVLHRRRTRIGHYRLWGRQLPPGVRPLRPLRPPAASPAPPAPPAASPAAPAAPNGAAP